MRTLPTLSRRSRPSTVILSCVTLLATGTLTASPALASGPIPSDLTFTDHQTGRKTVNLGGHDEFGVGSTEFTNGILKQGATTIGRSAGSCVVTRLGATSADALCTFTFVLTSQGQVTIQGIVRSTPKGPGTFTLAITGGTGAFTSARGTATTTSSAKNPSTTLSFAP